MIQELPCKHGYFSSQQMCPQRCHHVIGCTCDGEFISTHHTHAKGCPILTCEPNADRARDIVRRAVIVPTEGKPLAVISAADLTWLVEAAVHDAYAKHRVTTAAAPVDAGTTSKPEVVPSTPEEHTLGSMIEVLRRPLKALEELPSRLHVRLRRNDDGTILIGEVYDGEKLIEEMSTPIGHYHAFAQLLERHMRWAIESLREFLGE